MFQRKHSHDQPQNSEQEVEKVKKLKASIGPVSGRSLQYCTDASLRRYLRARNWNVDHAKKMLEESLKWRSTYKPEEIRWHEVANEGETGKAYRANFHDRYGRTVLIMRPDKQILKYILDAKSCQKVKFVYPENKESVELMRSYFDVENLPAEFGGNAKLQYDHQEFSRMMVEDDVKGARVWGIDNEIANIATDIEKQM
ncbi:hypothetical protein ACHQM5_015547 [Ranunculus cassubicifolius]